MPKERYRRAACIKNDEKVAYLEEKQSKLDN
jgi:hypothetical protein